MARETKEENILQPNTVRYYDEDGDLVDISPGVMLRHRKTGKVNKVLRVDTVGRLARWDLGSDEENNKPESRCKWWTLLNQDGIPFYEVVREQAKKAG